MRTTVDRGDYDTFTRLQSSEAPRYDKIIIYRRYWDSVNNEYTWETTGQEVTSDLASLGNLSKEYGPVLAGDWRIDNTTIELHNTDRYYGRDGSFWNGYLPEYTKVVVESGYVDVDDDTKHGINIFTGYISPKGGLEEKIYQDKVRINLEGGDAILSMYSAEDLPENQKENTALIGLNDPKEYITEEKAVGIVREVYDNGERLLKGRDYDVSDTNEKDAAGFIEFSEEYGTPTGPVTADYTHWYTDETFEFLINKLLDVTPIDNKTIQRVVFPTQLLTTRTQETDTDFNTGIEEGLGTEGQDKLVNGTWVSHYGEGYIEVVNYDALWVSDIRGLSQPFDFAVDTTISLLRIFQAPDSEPIWVKITIRDSSNSILYETEYQLGDYGADWINLPNISFNANETYKLNIEGLFSQPGVARISTTNLLNGYNIEQTEDGSISGTPQDETGSFRFLHSRAEHWMSDTINTDGIVEFGNFSYSATPYGTVRLYSRTQSEDAGWPTTFDKTEWEEIEEGVIDSTPEKYTRIAISIKPGGPHHLTSNRTINILNLVRPYFLDSFQFQFTTNRFNISVANYTGMSVRKAIERLAEMCDYAYGVTATERFYFRRKSYKLSADEVVLDGHDSRDFGLDYDRIVNQVKVSHGGYQVILSSKTEGAGQPDSIDKYGVESLSLNFATIIADPDADSAYGVARLYWKRYGDLEIDSEGKKKITVAVQPNLAYELGDVIKLTSNVKTGSPFQELWYISRLDYNPNTFEQELLLRELSEGLV